MELQSVPTAPCHVTDHHLEGPDSTFDVPFHQTSEYINKIPCLSFLFHGLKCPLLLSLQIPFAFLHLLQTLDAKDEKKGESPLFQLLTLL